jgi:hypothetical protein
MVWISGNWSMFLVTHWSITLPELFSFLLSCYMGGVGQRLFYLRTKDRLHYDIFSCPCTHTHHSTCSYVVRSSLALAHGRDATLWYFLLQLHNLAHTHTWCYVMMSFLGQNLPMDCSGKFWQSDNWPTTWKKDGKRAG